MATTINADTVTGGAIVTGDTSGVLSLQAAGTTLVTLNGATVAIASGVGLTSDSATVSGPVSTGALTASTATIAGLSFPSSDGSNGQAILTDGSGNLSFGAAGISTGKAIAMAIVFG